MIFAPCKKILCSYSQDAKVVNINLIMCSGAGTGGGPGGPLALPIFCRAVNPIQTGGGRLSSPITTGTPNVFHLPAPLMCNGG